MDVTINHAKIKPDVVFKNPVRRYSCFRPEPTRDELTYYPDTGVLPTLLLPSSPPLRPLNYTQSLIPITFPLPHSDTGVLLCPVATTF